MVIDILRKRIIENANRYFPMGDIKHCEVCLVPNRFRSTNTVYLFEVRLDHHNNRKEIVAKLTPPEESEYGGKKEYEMLKTLFGKAQLENQDFFVPRPLDYFDDLRVILTERVEGIKFSDLLRKKNRIFSSDETKQTLGSLMEKCGRCLRTIHDMSTTGKLDTLPRGLIGKINGNVAYLKEKKAINKREAEELSKIVQKSIEKIGGLEFPLVRHHGDFGVGNLLIKEGKITVLDFTFSTEDLIYNDIGHFLMTLEIINPYPRNILFDFRQMVLFKRRFLEGYFIDLREIKEVDWLLINLYKMRNIMIRFRSQYDDYSRLNRSLLFFIMRQIYKRRLKDALTALTKNINTWSLMYSTKG